MKKEDFDNLIYRIFDSFGGKELYDFCCDRDIKYDYMAPLFKAAIEAAKTPAIETMRKAISDKKADPSFAKTLYLHQTLYPKSGEVVWEFKRLNGLGDWTLSSGDYFGLCKDGIEVRFDFPHERGATLEDCEIHLSTTTKVYKISVEGTLSEILNLIKDALNKIKD